MMIVSKLCRRLDMFWKHNIVKEQYPLLTFLSRLKLKSEETMGVVYMLHHVAEKNSYGIPTNEDLKVSPSFLEKLIKRYKKQKVDFISLDTLYDILVTDKKLNRPFVVFTIDDGYLDNYSNALPVFEKYQIPFAIFVATDFIDRKALLWWDSLENLMMKHDEIVTNDGKCYRCHSFQERWDSFRYLRERILKLNQIHLEEELKKMFSGYDLDWYEPVRKQSMTWEQVRILAHHPLCTIGGHTVSHSVLNRLSIENVKLEVAAGIDKISYFTGKPVHYFAYPYGTPNEIGKREWQILEDLGIRLSFMAHQGCITSNHINSLSHLPRVYFRE